jgi:hypothetical protein
MPFPVLAGNDTAATYDAGERAGIAPATISEFDSKEQSVGQGGKRQTRLITRLCQKERA